MYIVRSRILIRVLTGSWLCLGFRGLGSSCAQTTSLCHTCFMALTFQKSGSARSSVCVGKSAVIGQFAVHVISFIQKRML